MRNLKLLSREAGTFLLFFLLYNMITLAPLIFYGPFQELAKMSVGTIATSRHPQFLKYIYPDKTVRMILADIGLENVLPEKNVTGTKLALGEFTDNWIELKEISGSHFKGKLLVIHNPKQVQVIATKDLNIVGEKTSDIAKRTKVAAAINGGGFLDPNGKGNGGWGIAPRTAIAQKTDGTLLLHTIDGRQLTSVGATLKEVQNLLLEEGAYNAANLDGGSSTTLYYQNQVINNPANPFGERYVPTAFVVIQPKQD